MEHTAKMPTVAVLIMRPVGVVRSQEAEVVGGDRQQPGKHFRSNVRETVAGSQAGVRWHPDGRRQEVLAERMKNRSM